MKVLLVGINAKYIHSNLAILYLSQYGKKYQEHIKTVEYTINNYTDEILQDIYQEKADIIAFSCYIWNMSMIDELCENLRKVLPKSKIWLGGPEVSYDAKEKLIQSPYIDGIMIGEGEETFLEILEYYIEDRQSLSRVCGIAYRKSACTESSDIENAYTEGYDKEKALENIMLTPDRSILDLSKVPFPYEDMSQFKNKIIYYETSRGCPYSCSYCLSSIDKKVRLRDIKLVQAELKIFLENKVPQVKFVDRTFNCNRKHAMAIWTYIKEHDNGITNFHFEVSADILSEEELQLLSTLRPGLIQLEIGVQSTNSITIKAIERKMDFDKLSQIVKRIQAGKNIHQHLDLIAGLPYEGYDSFRQSFDEVYALRPNQFQLGFLKVLKGSKIHTDLKENGIVYKRTSPYEVLYTPWLSYDEVLWLKSVENMVEIYYNSGQFNSTIQYLEKYYDSPFDMYHGIGTFYRAHHLNGVKYSRISRYEILLDYIKEYLEQIGVIEYNQEIKIFAVLLLHDLYLRENLKSRPKFALEPGPYKNQYRDFLLDEHQAGKILENYQEFIMKKMGNMTHIEHYHIHISKTLEEKKPVIEDNYILYDYRFRDPLNYEARTHYIKSLT